MTEKIHFLNLKRYTWKTSAHFNIAYNFHKIICNSNWKMKNKSLCFQYLEKCNQCDDIRPGKSSEKNTNVDIFHNNCALDVSMRCMYLHYREIYEFHSMFCPICTTLRWNCMNKEINEKKQQAFLINKREKNKNIKWTTARKMQVNTQQYGIFFFEYKQFAVITLISVVNKF